MIPLLTWLLGCQSTLSGQISGGQTADGTAMPVAGVVLEAPGCRAVSGADGRYTARCPPGSYRFEIRHPAFLDAALDVVAGRGYVSMPTLQLIEVPTIPGLYTQRGDRFEALPPAEIQRTDQGGTAGGGSLRYCVSGAPVAVDGTKRWLDVHGADWRIFGLDETSKDDCFYKMKEQRPGIWSGEYREVQVAGAEMFGASGGEDAEPEQAGVSGAYRQWIQPGLPAGRYVVMEVLGGIFVAESPKAQRYRGFYIEIQ